MREIAILRNNLFRISEPFIAQQAQHLKRYRPIYVGRLRFGPNPEGATSLILGDVSGMLKYPRALWQMLTRDPKPYLRLLAGRAPALIHAHFGTDGIYALPVGKRLRVPVVTTFHGFDATLSRAALLTSPAWANYALLRQKLAREGDLFICASSFLRDRLLALGFPEARTVIHYLGVDCDAISVRDPSEETATILHVARLVEVKGTQYLIRAVATLLPKHRDLRLVIIGDGPLRRRLQSLVDALNLQRNVEFHGALPHAQVLHWIRRAAMVVVPSVKTSTGRVEGMGMVHLEAAATGVPAIGSRSGGIPEGIVDRETGYLVPERQPNAQADRISYLIEHPKERHRLGANARRFVEERFRLHRQTEKLEALYDRLLSGKSETQATS